MTQFGRKTVLLPRMSMPAWQGALPVDVTENDVVDLLEALLDSYEGEACMTCYASDKDRLPRLGKASLAYYILHPDEMPTVQVVPVDIDYGEHETPPKTWHRDVLKQVQWPCGWYRTPHGMRLLFLPREPVPLNLANDYIGRVHRKLAEWGVEADPATRRWYRLFKLPKALNRDLPYSYTDMDALEWHPTDLTEQDASNIGPIVDRVPEDADLDRKITRRDVKPLGSKSKLADDIYHDRLAAPEGHRHATLLAAAGEIVSSFGTNDPLVPFELLAGGAERMGKDLDELWRICTWTAAAHAGEREAEEDARSAAIRRAADALDVPQSEVRGRLVIDAGAEWFVYDEGEQRYSKGYSHRHQILGALKRHCPLLAGEYVSGEYGIDVMMRDLSSVAHRVIYTYVEEDAGFDASTGTMTVATARIDPNLAPTYHHDVQQWLDMMFAPHRMHLLDWLSAVPELGSPICALYVDGPDSIGKGMLAKGIARLWNADCSVTPYSEMIGSFNSTLAYSPLIHADEKVPQDAFSNNDSSVFRRILGNDGLKIEAKFKAPATLRGLPRVLITANNEDALSIREELDAADLDAIRIRIGYIRISDEKGAEIKAWLTKLARDNDCELVRDYTKRWVEGGAIAEHILYLNETRERQPAGRFLVEGWESDLTENLATSVGSAGMVAEAIALAVSRNHAGQSVRWFGGHVFINTTTLASEWSYILGHDVDKAPSSQQRLKALKSLSLDTRRRLDVPAPGDQRKQRNYWQIPAETIARLAEDRNICNKEVILEACARENEPEDNIVSSKSLLGTPTPEA